jgi:PAS domain S-box-containing protein
MTRLLVQDKQLISELFDAQPESVVWFKAIYGAYETGDAESIVDFEAGYCNKAAYAFLGVKEQDIIGRRLFSNSVLDDETSELIFTQCMQVFTTGEPKEYNYYNHHFQRYYNVLRSKVKDGVLVVSRDRTEQYLRDVEYKKQARRYNAIIDSSGDGILLLDAIRNKNKDIVDFSIAHCNDVAAKLGRFPSDATSKTLLSVLPHLQGSEQFHMHRNVVETGTPVHFETTFRNEKGEEYGWFMVSLTKLEDSVFSRFVDISEKKKSQLEIENQAAFLNNILDASINGVFACEAIKDDSGRIVDLRMLKINTSFTNIIGISANEVIGKTYLTLFPSASELFELNCKVIETGVPVRKEIYYKGDNLDAWYDISLIKQGAHGLVVTFTDITARKKAFAEIEQQKNLLDSILKHSVSGICVIQAIRNEKGEVVDGQIILANEVSEHYSGIPLRLSLAKPLGQIDTEILNGTLFQMAVNTLETGKPFITQYLLQSTGKWLELAISKMDDNHLVNVFTDITERKEHQLQREKLIEELKRSNANLEEFTYAASHDLKEPIRKIRIFADRLKDGYSNKLDTEGLRILERLDVASRRMGILVNDLLEYSHVSLEMAQPEEIDLNQKLERVLGDLELEIEEKKAKIVVDHLPTIKGYRRQIQQLFQNLVGNALKYSKPGIPPKITISAQKLKGIDTGLTFITEELQKHFYAISVVDNGIGFEQKDAEKIFKVFQRLHGHNEYEGTGVGLSISKKVVRNHNGHITATSTPNVGSIFTIYLPA